MATDMDRAYCEWSHEQLADGHDTQGESVSGILDQGSISFGRFAAESLSWEKWSVFSHNRCQEELEKFKAPGLVAQKKAYFEEYYKKIRALKRLQEVQQDVDRSDSRDAGSDTTEANFYPNGEVDHRQHVELQNSENGDGFAACLPGEPEGFSNEITSQTDQCIVNSEAVDNLATEVPKTDSLDPDFPKPDINESSSCMNDALLVNEQKSGGNLGGVVRDQNGISLTIIEPAIVNQEEIARPKSPPTSCESIKTTQGTKQLSKIELNIKRYKEQTSHLKASVSSRNTRNLESLHKEAAIRNTNHRKLVDGSKPPSQGLKEPTKNTRATHSANPRTNLVSRVSKSASSDRLPTVTQRSSLLAERKRVVTPKTECNLSVNDSHKSSRSGAGMQVHAKETLHRLNISKKLRASGNAQKAAADRKRIPGHQSTKPGAVDRNHTGSRTTSANCRPQIISNIEGNKPNVERRAEFRLRSGPEEAKEGDGKGKSKLAASGSNKFTARPLPSFYKKISSNPEKKKCFRTRRLGSRLIQSRLLQSMPPSSSANVLPEGGKARPPSRHWR